jgi:hypothetical protein
LLYVIEDDLLPKSRCESLTIFGYPWNIISFIFEDSSIFLNLNAFSTNH